MRAPPVIVRTPLSRRKVLALAGGIAAVAGAVRLSAWAGEVRDDRLRLPAGPTKLAVAIPTGGDTRNVHANRPLLAAVGRVIEDVRSAGRGRFDLTVEEIGQPEATSPAPVNSQLLALAPFIASGAPPDLLVFTSQPSSGAPPPELTLVADVRAVLPLDDLLKGNTALTLRDFYPAALEVCRYDGKLVGVPLVALPLMLVYDEERFASAGVATPSAEWGWPQLLDAARRLTRTAPDGSVDQYGLIPSARVGNLLTLIWQSGGDVANAGKTRSTLGDALSREAIDYFAAFYTDRPASPQDAFTGWQWSPDGVRVNGQWWAAMTHANATGSSSPPVPGAKEILRGMFGEWIDTLGQAVAGRPFFRTPMRFAPLPSGRQRASALSVTATLSVSQQTKDPDAAGEALALLAEHVSRAVLPSARRLDEAVMQRLAPHYTPEQIRLLSEGLADARVLVVREPQRTNQVLAALYNELVVPVQRRMRPLDQSIEAADKAVQAILDRP